MTDPLKLTAESSKNQHNRRTAGAGTYSSDSAAHLEGDVRSYQRRWKQRRHNEAIRRSRRSHLNADEAEMLQLAHTWAPYGAVPAEEIFVRFGMSVSRFAERLWQIVLTDETVSREMVPRFKALYPRRSDR